LRRAPVAPKDLKYRQYRDRLRVNFRNIFEEAFGEIDGFQGPINRVNRPLFVFGTNGAEDAHEWGPTEGDVELREFPYYYGDIKAFLAAKTLWEWEHNWWLKQMGYL